MSESAPDNGAPKPFRSLPMVLTYRLSTIAPLVTNEQLEEWTRVLREKLGEQFPAALTNAGFDFGGETVTFLTSTGPISIPEDQCDSDYDPSSHA
jgi:hypothetical protein